MYKFARIPIAPIIHNCISIGGKKKPALFNKDFDVLLLERTGDKGDAPSPKTTAINSYIFSFIRLHIDHIIIFEEVISIGMYSLLPSNSLINKMSFLFAVIFKSPAILKASVTVILSLATL